MLEKDGCMKNFKKFFIPIICILLSISSLLFSSIVLSRNDYANLIYDGNGDNYIMLNGSQRYCYMPYYDYNFQPDIKIRNGNNPITALFKQSFGAYSKDSEKNFLYCDESGFGIQTVGLYIKETSFVDLFEPTSENIYRIVIYDNNNSEQLVFASENKKLFNYFIEKYSSELNDYFYPKYTTDEAVFNSDYAVHVEYQGGEISRFLVCIDKAEFEALLFCQNQ